VTHSLGLLIESLVALLLLLTIGYCIVLNQRLKRLKTDEKALREMIGELVAATDKAERAIGGLKVTVQESDSTLGERVRAAERLAAALEQKIEIGEKLLGGIAGVSSVADALQARSEPPPPPDAQAVVAAAQAFAERARARMFGRAA
jgi:hypothetical protein